MCRQSCNICVDHLLFTIDHHHQQPQGHMVEIPPGHVWLEGDNALNSTDSRYYGPVPSSLVKGRVILRVSHGIV